jgi:hypothetical protein
MFWDFLLFFVWLFVFLVICYLQILGSLPCALARSAARRLGDLAA